MHFLAVVCSWSLETRTKTGVSIDGCGVLQPLSFFWVTGCQIGHVPASVSHFISNNLTSYRGSGDQTLLAISLLLTTLESR